MTYRLLIVGKDDDITMMLKIYFSEKGYAVERAATEEQAVEKASHETFDVILMDTRGFLSPHTDAQTFVDSLRELPQNESLQFIVLTIRERPNILGWSPRDVFEQFVSSPFDIEELNLYVQSAIRAGERLRQKRGD
jgi:CheY-like chemotaxis protein